MDSVVIAVVVVVVVDVVIVDRGQGSIGVEHVIVKSRGNQAMATSP